MHSVNNMVSLLKGDYGKVKLIFLYRFISKKNIFQHVQHNIINTFRFAHEHMHIFSNQMIKLYLPWFIDTEYDSTALYYNCIPQTGSTYNVALEPKICYVQATVMPCTIKLLFNGLTHKLSKSSNR